RSRRRTTSLPRTVRAPTRQEGRTSGRHAARWSEQSPATRPIGDGRSAARALLVRELMEHKGSMQGRSVVPPSLLRGALLGTIASAGLGSVAWGGFIPGGGPERSDCYTQLYVANVESPGPQVKRKRIVSCVDGDSCDVGRCGNNVCGFEVAVCVGQT